MPRVVPVLMSVAFVVGGGGAAQADEPSPAATDDTSAQSTGQRVEAHDLGLAVTVPADWTVEDVYGEAHLVAPDGAICLVTGSRLDEPAPDPDALVDRVAAMWPHFPDGGPLPVVDEAEVMLPAGRSIRLVVDLALHPDPDEMQEGRFMTTYVLSNGAVLAFFSCWGDVRPADDRLTVARSFEFVPAAE